MTWPMIPLGELAEIIGGGTPRREETLNWGPGHYWATPTDLPMPGEGILDLDSTAETITHEGLRSSSTNLLPIGTVLYSTRATIGKLAIARVPVTTNQGFNNLIAGPAIYNRYLAYALQFFTPDICRLAGSTTFKEVSRSSLRGYEIPVPPMSEQHRIFDILEKADCLRHLGRDASAKAARILPALFLKTFGDPATNPMRWPVITVGTVLKATDYGTSMKASEDGSGLPLIRMGNVDYEGTLRLDDLKYVQLTQREVSKFALQTGDILFNRTNSKELVGKTGLWSGQLDAVLASYFIRVRVDREQIEPEFLWAFLNTAHMKRFLRATARGAIGQANINARELRAILMYKPPIEVQRDFVAKLKAIEFVIPKQGKTTELDDLFAVLLQRAFSGQLTAKWREAHMKELLVEMEQQARALKLPISQEITL